MALERVSTISPPGDGMTNAQPTLDVLALNSGSSSLKFGMYQIGSSQTEMLLSGEAESIGDRASRFHAQDSRRNALVSEKISFSSQREAILRIGELLVELQDAGTGRHWASNRTWRTEAPAALRY